MKPIIKQQLHEWFDTHGPMRYWVMPEADFSNQTTNVQDVRPLTQSKNVSHLH